MLGTNEHINGGINPEFLERYGPETTPGNLARRAESDRLIRLLDESESEIQHRELQIDKITDKIDRMNAAHRLEMDYLVSFGVRAEHRDGLRSVLSQNSALGGLTPRQAVALANSRKREPSHNSNGLCES